MEMGELSHKILIQDLVTSHLVAKFCFHEVMYCHSVCGYYFTLSLCVDPTIIRRTVTSFRVTQNPQFLPHRITSIKTFV